MKRRAIAVGAAAIAGFVLVLAVGALVFISAGTYNVAATTPHTALARWLMNTTQERSVAARADEVPPQPPVDSAMLRHGFEEYREMCVTCHGAPGVERGALGKGINPEPPDLAKESAEWSDRELFWITKHGIKMAGMPAFGAAHSDEELWGIVAFVRRLESMSAEEYRRLASEGEMQAHAGMVETAPQAQAGTQEMDHDRMDHSRTAAPTRRTGARMPSRDRMAGMEHGGMPGRRRSADRPAGEPAQVDADATEKLKTLAAELLRDSVVSARVRADSALQRRWENDNLRSQLARPPR
jgi:mono/diheme cytochrome c family protein